MTTGFGPRFAVPILLGPALNPLNTTMIAVALVPISTATGTPTWAAVWLVAALYLAGILTQPLVGRLVDLWGPRRMIVAGMALTAAAGVVPLVWPSFTGALIARVAIGVGTSVAYPAAMASIAVQADRVGRQPPRALFAALSVSNLVTAAAGPVLGGALVTAFGWQAIFVVNTPFAVVVIAGALLGLPRGTAESAVTPAGRPVGVRALARGDLVRTFCRFFLVSTATYLMLYGFLQWLQSSAGYTAAEAGWMQLPAVIVAAAAAASQARLRGVRAPLIVAAGLTVVGGALVLFAHPDAPVWLLLVPIMVFGLPQGLASVANQAVLYRHSPRAVIGSAAGLSRTSVQLGGIAASAIVGLVFGAAPTDAGVHVIGGILIALGLGALLLTTLDRELSARSGP